MMYDELTRGDVQKMQEEIDYRTQVLRPKLIEDVQTARAFGDLSENFEYKCAKQEKNRNDSRIHGVMAVVIAVLALVFRIENLIQPVLLPQHGCQAARRHPDLVWRTNGREVLTGNARQVRRIREMPIKEILLS